MPLDAEQQRTLMQRINVWRADPKPKRPVACPVCGKDGVDIIDRSARPYAEWYAVSCKACGLSETLHIPLGPPVQSLD